MKQFETNDDTASFANDISVVVQELSRLPRASSESSTYQSACDAFDNAVNNHLHSGVLEKDMSATMVLWNCGFTLMETLETVQHIDPHLWSSVWMSYETLSSKLGIDLYKVYAEERENDDTTNSI